MMKEKKVKEKLNNKGSMTVEAVIVLPIFLMLFMFMMYMVNICTAYLTLNHTVDQTSKYNANSIYVYNTLRTYLDESMDETHAQAKQDVQALILGAPSLPFSLNDFFSEKVGEYYDKYIDNLEVKITDEIHKEVIIQPFIVDMLAGSEINSNDVEITLYKLPNSQVYGDNSDEYEESFAEDDLVLQLTYAMPLNIPFIEKQDFKIVSTCVEKGWLSGAKTNEYVDFEQTSFFEKLVQ